MKTCRTCIIVIAISISSPLAPAANAGHEALRWILFDNHKFTSGYAQHRFQLSFMPEPQHPALLAYLIGLKVDTLLVTGISTSGCVRATVVDGFSYNYRISVIADACADRSQASHAVNLCDMDAKYADVVMSGQVIEYIGKLPGGLFGPRTG